MISYVSLHPVGTGELRMEAAPDCGHGEHARLKIGVNGEATVFLQPSQVAKLQRLCSEYLEARREVPMFASRVEKA